MSTVAPPVQRRTRASRASTSDVGRMLLMAVVWLGALACIFPLVWTLVSSFRSNASFLVSPFYVDPRQLSIDNYRATLSDGSVLNGLKNSTIQVVIILATTLFFCPLAGYGFAKFTFPGKRFLFGLMMLTLFFVPITQYVPLLLEMNALGWVDTYQSLVMPLVISSLGIFWMNAVIAGIPNELLHAARVDGCGSFGAWWRIVLPIVRPALVSLAVVSFLTAYNDYFWPLLILPETAMQTVQIALQVFVSALGNSSTSSSAAFGPVLAASTIVFLPTIIIFLLMQRYFIRGMLEGSVKE